MRRFLERHRWFTFLVAGLLVFATSGLMLSRMTCLIGGHSVYGIGLLEDCCPEEEHSDGPMIMAQCCDLGAVAPAAIDLLVNSTIDLDAVLIALEAMPFSVMLVPETEPLHWLESRPPPDRFDDRQAVHSIFLI